MAVIISDAVLDALREAGIADDKTRRVVIDLQANHVPVVYIERFGDRRLLAVVEAMAGVEIVTNDAPSEDDRAGS